MDYAILSFSFLQGVVAFFAPCAVALLPGYLSRLIGRQGPEHRLRHAAQLAGLTVLGLALIFSLAGLLILHLTSFIKENFVYLNMVLAVVLIGLGGMMLAGKNVSLPIHGPQARSKHASVEAFLFGITYAIASLGCLFPLFLNVVTFAAGAPNFLTGAAYLGAYAAGMIGLMFAFYIGTVYGQSKIQRWLSSVLPYVNRVGGGLIVAAGAYMIHYNWALFTL